MSKKDIRKYFKGKYSTGKWLKRYFEKRTTKRKHSIKGDDGSVAEELFANVNLLESKILAVDESVSEGFFTLNDALKNYGITEKEYGTRKN